MPIRTIDPREDAIVDRLIGLDVGDGRKALRESLRIGYTVDQVAGIIDWYESLILVDPASGERVVPYWPGALVIRLRDEDSRRALPSQGKWGGKRGEWTALQLRLSGPTPGLARVPDHSLTRRSGVIESLTREQVEHVLQELIDRGGTLGERAGKCLGWMTTGWPEGANLIVPPGNVTRFLMQVDVEAIIKEIK